MKMKDRETLTPSSFSFAAAYLASEFYSAKKPGLPVKIRTPVLQKASGNRLCRLRYMQS